LPSRWLLAVRLAISSHIFFTVVTIRNLFLFSFVERLRSPSRRLRRVMVERLVRIIILAVRLFHRSQVRAENALFPHHPPASLGIIIIIANVSVHPRAACGA